MHTRTGMYKELASHCSATIMAGPHKHVVAEYVDNEFVCRLDVKMSELALKADRLDNKCTQRGWAPVFSEWANSLDGMAQMDAAEATWKQLLDKHGASWVAVALELP